MSGSLNWTKILGPLGLEAPGYQETLAACRANPWVKSAKKAKPATKKTGKKAHFPSAKHGSD